MGGCVLLCCFNQVSDSGDITEPYEFLYETDDVPLAREKYHSYAPVASFFVSRMFTDIPMTCTDDWETATGLVYPPNHTDYRCAKKRQEAQVAWESRVATAIFRGNSTGPGVNANNNQRIKLAVLSSTWRSDPRYNDRNPVMRGFFAPLVVNQSRLHPHPPFPLSPSTSSSLEQAHAHTSIRSRLLQIDGVPFLDAGVIGWNLRDRKLQGLPMTYIKATVSAVLHDVIRCGLLTAPC